MMAASTSTATVIPSPISFVVVICVNVNAAVTIMKSSAAFVMTPPVISSPRATAQRLLCERSHSSRMRESRNTS